MGIGIADLLGLLYSNPSPGKQIGVYNLGYTGQKPSYVALRDQPL